MLSRATEAPYRPHLEKNSNVLPGSTVEELYSAGNIRVIFCEEKKKNETTKLIRRKMRKSLGCYFGKFMGKLKIRL